VIPFNYDNDDDKNNNNYVALYSVNATVVRSDETRPECLRVRWVTIITILLYYYNRHDDNNNNIIIRL